MLSGDHSPLRAGAAGRCACPRKRAGGTLLTGKGELPVATRTVLAFERPFSSANQPSSWPSTQSRDDSYHT